MAKHKLTRNQQRRIHSNNKRALFRHQRKEKETLDWQEEMLGDTQDGLVVARYSMHADVENSRGEVFRCNLRRTLANVVVGDYVIWRQGHEKLQGISGVIEGIKPRRNELSRPDYYDGIKVMAANIDRIVIVSAVLPVFSLNIIDRYLIVCETVGISPLIVLNKADMLDSAQWWAAERQLKIYRDVGYDTLMVSAKTGKNMAALTALLAQGTSIFVGQSGVGKSSLVNRIMPEVQAQTGGISEVSGLGQHTTTASRLYHLPGGGNLIDSPGIRKFGLWHLTPEQITKGYREFRQVLGTCKFRDCTHLNDPGCALRAAVEMGKIHPIRFANYHRLLQSRQKNKSQRHFIEG